MGDFSKINNTLCLYSTLIDFRLTLKYKNTCEKLHDFYRKSRKIYRIRSTLPKKIRAKPFFKIAAVRYDLVQINFIINEKVRIRNVLVILTDYPFSFLQSRASEFYTVSVPYGKFYWDDIVPKTRNVSICWETNFPDENTYWALGIIKQFELL